MCLTFLDPSIDVVFYFVGEKKRSRSMFVVVEIEKDTEAQMNNNPHQLY